MLNKIGAISAAAFLSASPAFAYIDPGTGMSFVSGLGAFLVGLIAAGLGFIAVTFKRWKALIGGFFSRSKTKGPEDRH